MSDFVKRNFDKEALNWDKNQARVGMTKKIADCIIKEIPLNSETRMLDYGCGTGLVTLSLQPLVGKITAADSSSGMLAALKNKLMDCNMKNVDTLLLDLDNDVLSQGKYNLIITSMVLHHIKDTTKIIGQFYKMLGEGGYLCIVDLDKEDGSFHADLSGIEHFGFERESMFGLLKDSGFSEIEISTVCKFEKEVARNGAKEFSLFIAKGIKIK